MTATITADRFGDVPERPTVILTVTGLTAGQTVDIYRQTPNETYWPVRGAVARVATTDALSVPDTLPSLGVLNTYVVAVNGVYASAASITLDWTEGHHVINDLVTGEGVICEVIYDEDARTQEPRYSSLTPVGANYPVVIYDRRSADSGTYQIYTPSRTDSNALASLLANGNPMALRSVPQALDIASLEIFYPLSVTRSRFTRQGARMWSVPFLEIALPDPRKEIVLSTLADIANVLASAHNHLADLADISSMPTLLDISRYDWADATPWPP